MKERDIIRRCFAPIAGAGARQLLDDCAVIAPPPGRDLVLTTDMLASGVHFFSDDPPADIAHKLLAANLSDLAAKGAVPLGCLLGLALPKDCPDGWIETFAAGLGEATRAYNCPLLGGDTISGVTEATLSMSVFGHTAPGAAFDRRAARSGDLLVLSGTAGDAGLALKLMQGRRDVPLPLQARYRRPEPRLALGQALAGLAHACADVSDGVLIDAAHIGEASQLAIRIDLESLPLSDPFRAASEMEDTDARIFAATAGDDYELLFTISPQDAPRLLTLSTSLGLKLSVIGICLDQKAQDTVVKAVLSDGRDVTPVQLGFQH